MTSFVGKWKLLVIVLFVGFYAFAKAETPAHIVRTIHSSTEIATFSIDKSSTRTEIFDLFKELFLNHGVKAKLNGYKRHGGIIVLLELTLTDQNGTAFPLHLQNKDGIDQICLTLNPALNSIIEFAPCEQAVKAVTPVKASQYNQVYDSALVDSTDVEEQKVQKQEKEKVSSRQTAQEVIAARKAKAEKEIEAARLRVKQQQEQRRIDVLARKQKLEAQQQENKLKNEQLIAERALKREQQLKEVSDRQLARRQKEEAARIAKLEEEKKQIALETARLDSLAQEERHQLALLEKERLAAQMRQEQRRLQEELDRQEAQRLKEEEKERAREVIRVRKRLEAERLEQVKAENARVKKEKEALELRKLERELELEKLAMERQALQDELNAQLERERLIEEEKRRAARLKEEQQLIDERERYLEELDQSDSRKQLMLNANELDYVALEDRIIEQGYLIFNAEQCSFKVYMGRTFIYDAFGNKILTIEDELIDAPQSGKVIVNKIEATYEFTENLLIIKNLEGQLIDEEGKVVGAGINSDELNGQEFKVTHSFKIETNYSTSEIKNVLQQIAQYQFDTELLELEYSDNGNVNQMVFRIDDESFVFNMLDSVLLILIEIDERNNRVKVSEM
ncbi:hypothetical protein BBFL7_00692 [Flavobacteria bacterium BBFL7]|nr:hypothetical protein BBFL7_00692 [Flavobacteria bacterium BBFL7]